MSLFVPAKGIKTVHGGGGGVKKRKNSVHIVVEYPLTRVTLFSQKVRKLCSF